MKPLKSKTANMQIEGDGLRKTKFKVGVSEAQIIKYLTSLYSDKYRAAFSEIASNAMDEVLFAFSEDRDIEPYEILLPTQDDPNLRIRDYGRGMEREFAFNQMTTYGFSTKDEDNVALGGKGIGLKSPLALGPFSVETVHKGLLTVIANVPDGGEGSPEAIETFHGPTDEPDGTTVVIPAGQRDVPEFTRVCKEFLKYMPKKVRPKVSGVEVDYFWDRKGATDLRSHKIPIVYDRDAERQYYRSDDTTELTFIIGYRPYTVRMSSMPLEARNSHETILKFIDNPIYIFPIGYLSISDNRETIDLDRVTIERLEKHFKNTEGKLIGYFEEKLKTTKSIDEALEAAQVLRGALGRQDYDWTSPEGHTFTITDYGKVKLEKYFIGKLGKSTFYEKTKETNPITKDTKTVETKRKLAQEISFSGNSVGSKKYQYGLSCFTEEDNEDYFRLYEYCEDWLDDDGKFPILWCDRSKAKNWKVRAKYFVSEEGKDALDHSFGEEYPSRYGSKIIVYFFDPTCLTEAFPDMYEVIALHDLVIPKKTSISSSPKSFLEKIILHGSNSWSARYIDEVSKNRSKYLSYEYEDSSIPKNIGNIYYVPIVGSGYTDYPFHNDTYGYGPNRGRYSQDHLRSDIHRMIDGGALRANDVIVFPSLSIRRTKAWATAVKSREVKSFLHLYRRFYARTSYGQGSSRQHLDTSDARRTRHSLDNFQRTFRILQEPSLLKEAQEETTKVEKFLEDNRSDNTGNSLEASTFFPEYLRKHKGIRYKKVEAKGNIDGPKAFVQKFSLLKDHQGLQKYYLEKEGLGQGGTTPPTN